MIVCPETESAVQTIPAIAITKNMPVRPETPNSSRITDEMMIVSIVMPETGLRAVVAIALAATEVKKNEKTSTRARPISSTTDVAPRLPRKIATATEDTTTPTRIFVIAMSRSVRSIPSPSPCRNAFAAMEKEPTTIRSDFRMPKMPAVAMAPTPT